MPDCVVLAEHIEGPYFVDERLLRSDIRRDPVTGAMTAGAPLDVLLTIAVVDTTGRCTPLAGAQVDIWQCDAMGRYQRDWIYRDSGPQLTLPVAERGQRYAASFTVGMRPRHP